MAEQPESRARSLQTGSLTIAALIVAAGFLASRVAGLLRSVIIAGSYGTSPELDAYWVAFRLPDLVFQLLAGATLASAFIPTFLATRHDDGEEASWRLASSVLNLVLVATLVFAAVAFILAPLLVPLLAPGLGEGSGREAEINDLAVELTRVMLLSPILFAVSGMFMGILNARRHFLTPALAPVVYNLSIIVAALISSDVRVLAAGVVAGAALHLAVQLPDLRNAGMVYHRVMDWKNDAVRQVGRLMGPRVLGLAATQINFYFVAVFFASTLSVGAISAVSFAWLIVMTPLGVIGMAISTAAFPTLAEQAAERRHDDLADTLSRALRLIMFLSLPAVVGLVLLAEPAVTVLLQRGEFDNESTELTSHALTFYAIGLFAHAGIEIVSRGFYALSDTRTPVLVALAAMLLNVVLTVALIGPLEVKGLALALSLATTAEFAALCLLLAPRLSGVFSQELRMSLTLMVAATALTGCVIAGVREFVASTDLLDVDTGSGALALVALCAGAGGVFYLAAARAFGLPEPLLLLARFRRQSGMSGP